jgi:hypothetical protein
VSDSQPNLETIAFKIGLTGTYWDRKPKCSVLLNGENKSNLVCDENLQYAEFTCDLAERQEHLLEIKLENKTITDTIVENSKIVKDMLLNIKSIEIDEMELGEIKWNLSEFVADDPNRPTLKNCVNLGWNGSYRLKFTSPFYLWLLENM